MNRSNANIGSDIERKSETHFTAYIGKFHLNCIEIML